MRVNYNRQINKVIDISKISRVSGREFQKGQILKGEVLDIKQKNILIRLANSTVITAKLTDQMEFSIGQKVMFQVKESNMEQILLKPIMDESSNPKSNKLSQILEEANVTVNNKNIEIVDKLLNNNMKIDKEFINKILTLTRQFKDTDVDKLILLLKNDIPVTEENIEQLNNYIKNNNSIKQDMISLANHIIDDEHINVDVKQKLINIFTYSDSDFSTVDTKSSSEDMSLNVGSQEVSEMVDAKLNSEFVKNQQVSTDVISNQTNDVNMEKLGDILSQEGIDELKDEINNTYTLKGNNTLDLSKDLTMEKLQQEIFALEIKEEIKKHIMNNITNRLLKTAVDKNIYLSKNALNDPKLINEYFNDIYNKVVNILKLTQGTMNGKNSAISKDAAKIKNNIEFMNNLNSNFNYVQLPFKFNNKLVGSELYIFENKKSPRKKANNNSISALLRLDYVNLGHIDVYINKLEKNIELKFYVDDDKTKNVIDNHIINLHKKIISYDYNIMGLTVINNNKNFDFVKDFMKRKSDNKSVKRYTFDMRV
ncbi:hypothetical protein SH1V18_42080 [Vallitalea longa]|uniref:Flagellar hook-length control protein FliK n=1 Tax=Vallitalea longa TaxID=2936439 RepID=A0A9W6DHR0_9FIRM|nr:hypothetical protein [Vallitalea longa]GKX31728.1 hypothetical protein SH1V18_42080 [Vallitalea longa]